MAGLLYTYAVTSIHAAKRNAQLHREADGGQLDMRRESLRRHGVLEKVEGTGGVQLFRDSAKQGLDGPTATNNTKLKGSSSGQTNAREPATGEAVPSKGRDRTHNEGQLEEYKKRVKLRELGTKEISSE